MLSTSGLVAFFVLWQFGSRAGWIDPFFFSSPSAIAAAAVAEVQVPRFWEDVKISALELGVGSLAAVLLAVPLGIAIGWYRRVSFTFDPWLKFFNALPRVALVPLVVLWAGLGIEMKTVIVFLGGFFSIILPTVEGVRTVERSLLDVARSFRREAAPDLHLARHSGDAAVHRQRYPGRGRSRARRRDHRRVLRPDPGHRRDDREVGRDSAARPDAVRRPDLHASWASSSPKAVGSVERYLQRWRPSIDLEEAA